jgi:hypothetical protein
LAGEKNPHRLEVERHREGLEEVVADHAGEVEAEGVLPRERPIVETRDIVFPQVSKRKLAHGVGHDFQRSAGPRTFGGLVFLKLNFRLLDDRLRELGARTRQPRVDEQDGSVSTRPQPTMK